MSIKDRSLSTFAPMIIGATILISGSASAAECYRLTGWSSTAYVGAQALVVPTSYGVTPMGTAWLQVYSSSTTPRSG